MTSKEVRQKYLEFFKKRRHAIIPSSPIIPENDPTTLFTGSGMQPMIPYLLGQKHPLGTRIADSQKSFRTVDIDEVGDNRHTTFFEMLGNWSLGDYFKKEQIPWIFEFLTKEIGIDPEKLYVTTFIGDDKNNIPKDTETAEIWKGLFEKAGVDAKDVEIGSEKNGYELGMQEGRIFYYDVSKNWWSRAGVPDKMPVGEPGGPDTEMFYRFTDLAHDTKYGKYCHPNCDCGQFIEIGNNVFMEYKKNVDGTFSKLPQRNVDFGGGLERIIAASINTPDIFQIDIFKQIINTLERLSGRSYHDQKYTASFRVIADHVRAASFLMADGVNPSNTDQGYFTRRLIRRAVRFWDKLGIQKGGLAELVGPLLNFYQDSYPLVYEKREQIKDEVASEEERFRQTLARGLKHFNELTGNLITGQDAFILFTTYGFPVEVTQELAKERVMKVDMGEYDKAMKEHQALSRSGSEQKFKGGLADHSKQTVQYHTTHHILLKALQSVLGPEVHQRGSNITAERLRIDFASPRKMTDDEKKKVEEIVNQKIQENLPVIRTVMKKEDAENFGAEHEFNANYPEMVTIYSVGPKDATIGEPKIKEAFSIEFCGGPHVTNTEEIAHTGVFKIIKEEAVATGIRRIKAVVV
ncbi:MAG: alanine--tRNA ligase [Candidatus Vogelbacteria bacterium]|nr:alanine--tRNA ligase [Candidatus Vogelbacteria bacterium]